MDPAEGNRLRFCRFIRSFQCEKVPCDLFVRACEPKLTWSSSGEVVERLPLEAGVPEWVTDLYNTNKHLLHDAGHGAHIGGLEIIIENGVTYFEVATAIKPETELCQLSSIADERSMAQERIGVFLQAFPSINIEIIGEEIVERLIDIAKRSILPLLLCVTEADIIDWLFPKNRWDLESYIFSFFEFLYQVIAFLGVEHPLLPLSLPERILNTAPHDLGNDSIVTLRKVADIVKHFKDNGPDLLDDKPLPPGTETDQRSHAMLGYFLSLQNNYFSKALKTWQPLLSNSPSQMEYLAAISFCDQSRLALSDRPAILTLDTRVLEGLLRSRRKQYDQAAKALEATRVELVAQYGPCSMQLGIVTSELANCYNVLRREALAEFTLTQSLELRRDSNLSNRRDEIYLRLALADSFIGQAKYKNALPILENIIDKPNISATFRMMSALRLTRSRRRMHGDAREAFKQKSPLWTGLSLLDIVPDVLVMEYVEELGCCISQLPKRELEDSNNVRDLVKAVNSALRTSSSVTSNPCWEWYTNCQQEYSGQIRNATMADKRKRWDEVLQNEDPIRIRTPISPWSPASSCPSPRAVDDTFVDKGPWSERSVLSFDGGGVRAISSLLILKRIMQKIEMLELTHPDGPCYSSSDSMWSPRDRSDPLIIPEESDRIERYFPCHYFDYVAGTSTGGLMLGRLRMSVDQAIDNFINFGNTVFGRPRLFHTTSAYFPSRTKYPAANVRRAFQNITKAAACIWDNSAWDLIGDNSIFQENNGGIRTIVLSFHLKGSPKKIWRSWDHKEETRIWEVASATSATPGYFDAIEIDGATYLDGSLVANNPSYRALEEVLTIHRKVPVLFINIGTGTQDGNDVTFRSDTKWRDLRWRDRLQRPNRLFEHTVTEFYADSETKQFLQLARDEGLEEVYRLSAREDLQAIPFDDWQPAVTGKKTVQEITNITNEYLDKDEVRKMIDRIAKEAVRIRRARARTEQWKRFI
ncbi:guanine nucleotide-binding alpha-3 subunit [Fusarium globosum]|uniref:Guanine nucleotide-binding alpha-3 subunit n=1 Tax=Fusarium globosum TaxID=78864 RepID=A0A8H5XVL3_9HYPO|nr:guanine nucleotide-binding alpha-3 subunit [Fusarium globosum]